MIIRFSENFFKFNFMYFHISIFLIISQNYNSAMIPAEIEIYSKDLEKLRNQTLIFDLDMDTKPDQLHCTYHSRYGDIGCTVSFSKLGKGIVRAGCDRFGILESKTNGIHNLICDHSDILTWDPKIKGYIEDTWGDD